MQRSLNRKPLPPRRMSEWQPLCDCTHCTLRCEGQVFLPVPGSGSKDAQLIFVGEAPGEVEVAINQPFVGPSGRLLDDTLEMVGLKREDVYCTNAVLCRPPDNRNPTATEIMACNQRLKQEILALPQRHVIVVLGTPAVKAVTGRNDGIMASIFKTEWNAEFNCFVVFAYHPAACLRNADYYQDVVFTLRHAVDLLSVPKGPITVPPVTYDLEDDVSRCLARLQVLMGAKEYIACDVETTGLDWRVDTLEQLGLAWSHYGRDRAYLIPKSVLSDSRVRAALKKLLGRRDVQWVWHNGKFDCQFIKKYGVAEAHVDIDTMLMNKSLDERSGVHGLKQIGARFFGDYEWGEEKSGFTDPVYHAKDCVYTLLLGRDVLPAQFALEPPSLQGYPNPRYRHDNILTPVWNVIVDIEMRGILIDTELLPKMERECDSKLVEMEKNCQQLADVRFPVKQTQKSIKAGEQPKTESINIRSTKQLRDFFYNKLGLPEVFAKGSKTQEPTVNVEMLGMYRDRHPFIPALIEYRKLHKLYSTYVLGAVEESAWDGCIHTHFTFNPVTGRPSSSDLNIQNIPSKSAVNIKQLYIARPGYWFVNADYKNQEIRGAAWYSKCPALNEACQSKDDFHMSIARGAFAPIFAKLDPCQGDLRALEHLLDSHSEFYTIALAHRDAPMNAEKLYNTMADRLRFYSKAISFGIVYGQGAQGLQENLAKKGVIITVQEAGKYISDWLGRYPELAVWLRQQRKQIVELGFVDTPLGHRRRKYLVTEQTLGEAERQAMNSPIQGLASDMTMLSVIELNKILQERRLGHILAFVHDSIAFEIKKERLEEGAAVIKQTMEHALDFIQKPDFYVPFPVDIEYGRGWGELQKLSIA